VAATGFGRPPALPDEDFGNGPIPDVGNGWYPQVIFDPGTGPVQSIFNTVFASVAPFSNYNTTIAAMGYGIPQTFHPYLLDAGNVGDGSSGNPYTLAQGVHYGGGIFSTDVTDFGTQYSTAYIAGAASMVYQALAAANGGTFPTDVDTVALNTLLATADFGNLDRIDQTFTANAGACAGGYLNANKAVNQAISGGTLFSNPMGFTGITINQPLNAVTIKTDVQLTANVANGTGPFSISVDWGDGTGPHVTNNWVPGTVITLTGGYKTLGHKSLNVQVTDSKNQTITGSGQLFVINPLTGSVTVTDQSGNQVALSALTLATPYIFEMHAANLYTGTFDDDNNPATPEIPNTTTFEWDFGDGTAKATGTSPSHSYTSPGTKTVTVTAKEDFRPDQVITVQVTVQ
jgi:hypothetical protein